MKNKVNKFIKMLYIEPGTVLSLTHMFYVCKVLNDIWIVYNGNACGLNIAVWAPHFGLPIVQQTLSALLPGYSQCDMDVGNMFFRSPFHPDLIPYAGVDITQIKSRPDEEVWEQDMTRVWERWANNFMGLTDSPY